MLTLISIVCLGFVLGMRHATDADHVIAVTTIVSREKAVRNAAFIGAMWGLGHTLTLMVVGGAIVWFGLVISPRAGMSMEFSVGLMLVFLGVWNLKTFGQWLVPLAQKKNPDHVAHSPSSHEHDDQAVNGWLDLRFGQWRAYQVVRPFVIGVVHGMAGSAALALMVLPVIQHPNWALVYLGVFGAGTIAGMMVITATIAWPLAHTVARSAVFHRRLVVASGFLSLGFGLFMIYEIGFVQGLLTK